MLWNLDLLHILIMIPWFIQREEASLYQWTGRKQYRNDRYIGYVHAWQKGRAINELEQQWKCNWYMYISANGWMKKVNAMWNLLVHALRIQFFYKKSVLHRYILLVETKRTLEHVDFPAQISKKKVHCFSELHTFCTHIQQSLCLNCELDFLSP